MMLYTVDKINENKDFLPGVKIGVHILDDCDKDTYGLEQAVEFIKGEFFDKKISLAFQNYGILIVIELNFRIRIDSRVKKVARDWL